MQPLSTLSATSRLPAVLDGLRSAFGAPPAWRRRDPVGQLVRSMLGEGLRDATTEAMFARLRTRFATWTALATARIDEVQPLIAVLPRSEAKAADILSALQRIGRRSGALRLDWLTSWTLDDALAWLGELPGVSPAAAAAVLNVSTLQRCILVVDDQVLRVVRRLGLCDAKDDVAACSQRLSEEAPAEWDADFFTELHIQLSRLGETYCRPSGPDCGGCPIRADCAHAARLYSKPASKHAPANDTGPLPDRLDDYLRRRIARIERDGVSAKTVVDTGLRLGRPIDEAFVGCVLPAGVHHCAGARMEDGSSRYILALAALAAQSAPRPDVQLLVVQEEDAVREYGQLHGPGLEAFGVGLGHAAFLKPRDAAAALQIADEAVRAAAAPLLILELRRGAALADTAVTRCLNLQARRAGMFVFLVTPNLDGTSAAMTRWLTTAIASEAPRRRVGSPAVRLDLVRNRSGQTGSWVAQWSAKERRLTSIQRTGVAEAPSIGRAAATALAG